MELPNQRSTKIIVGLTQPLAPRHIKVVPAKPEDIDIVLGILDEAASWLQQQNIPTVWKPGEFSRQAFVDQISRGEVHIGLVDEKPAGTLTLQWSDPMWWRGRQPDSGCVHKIAVRPAYAGQSIGREMLSWAEAAARKPIRSS